MRLESGPVVSSVGANAGVDARTQSTAPSLEVRCADDDLAAANAACTARSISSAMRLAFVSGFDSLTIVVVRLRLCTESRPAPRAGLARRAAPAFLLTADSRLHQHHVVSESSTPALLLHHLATSRIHLQTAVASLRMGMQQFPLILSAARTTRCVSVTTCPYHEEWRNKVRGDDELVRQFVLNPLSVVSYRVNQPSVRTA